MSQSVHIEREIPQTRYGNGIRSGQLETIYFDTGISQILNVPLERSPPDWGCQWTTTECAQKWSVRVHWPGYDVLTRQINVKDHARTPQPVSKHKLGQRVAKAIQNIMEELAVTQCKSPEWRVGPDAIRPEDVVLLGLHNISQGSWQPSLGLKRRW
ncbi:hypothetical protein PHLGIDRAFT_338563 [Phlebiopsis gigantea 11061_1 CR5-6]|uniref:Uncharacterized protein n=1 Tax=Phlebiopsis gigantea (strain 11061_1 CR5-6) TaxID=745531 RepID=A0A0C3SAJ5_PHLG1|nr:hypothetical protein PHLGIDRAFT_338563 [Phlebiopsis gigantea 11061_1 CR5-6]